MTNKQPLYFPKREDKKVIALGLSQVITGVENPNEQEVIQVYSKADGRDMNVGRDKVEAQEIFNIKKQKHSCWFVLDLETGRGRTDSWFPGCVVRASVLGNNIPIRSNSTDDAEIVEEVSNAIVELVDVHHLPKELDSWYKVKFTKVGYIKSEYLSNLRYEAPNKH